jgi:predicted transcriptional regulator
MANPLKVLVGNADDFFKRSLGRAQKLDRGEKLLPEMLITFENRAQLMRALTVRRVDLIAAIRK